MLLPSGVTIYTNYHALITGYSSVGRASDCRELQQSDGPWFDSGWPDFQILRFAAKNTCGFLSKRNQYCALLTASIAQLAEHALRKRTVVGSIPTGGFFVEGMLE